MIDDNINYIYLVSYCVLLILNVMTYLYVVLNISCHVYK